MNELTEFTQPQMMQEFINNTERFNDTADPAQGQFLKMEQDSGDWVFGAEDEYCDPESIWAINIATLEQGWVCWHRSQLMGRHSRLAHEPPILVHDLPPLPPGQDWTPMKKMVLKCIEGPNESDEVVYETSSRGGREAIKKITKEIARRSRDGSSMLLPLVQFNSYTYPNKISGKDVRNPVFDIVGWSDGKEIAMLDLPVLEEEPAIKKRSRKRA